MKNAILSTLLGTLIIDSCPKTKLKMNRTFIAIQKKKSRRYAA